MLIIIIISVNNVDIISGWYSSQYDLPYIINRCKALGLNYKVLSPINRVTIYKRGEYWKIYIEGLDHIDLMDALKDLGYNLSNWKLETAAREILENPDIEKLKQDFKSAEVRALIAEGISMPRSRDVDKFYLDLSTIK